MFLKETIKNYKTTGAIAPSSVALAKTMVKMGSVPDRNVIVEFGTGTGVFTNSILKHLSSNADYIGLELNPKFYNRCKKRFTEAKFYLDTAVRVRDYLQMNNHPYCDCIISGLPFANFDDHLQLEILNSAIASLQKDGVFLTFAYTIGLKTKKGKAFRKKIDGMFSKVIRSKVIYANLPPAIVYKCIK